nr:pyrB leader peptide - Bacillus subtilis [Bacillus subtilis]
MKRRKLQCCPLFNHTPSLS